jgi:hypothetical protein
MYLKYGKLGAARPAVSKKEAMALAVQAFQKAFEEDKKRRTMSGEVIPFDQSRGRRKMSGVAEKKEIVEVAPDKAPQRQDMSNPFASVANFEAAQRMAMALSKGSLIPEIYQNNIPNCLIALEISQRLNASVLMVMQNLYVVHGKPGWSAQYIISAINSCRRFSQLRFKFNAEKTECTAYATDLKSGELIEGSKVTWAMAIAEGWVDKKGSKWKTMPEQMFMYRAASFFGKAYVPEILMGFQTVEELEDIENSKKPTFVEAEVEPAGAKISPEVLDATFKELEAQIKPAIIVKPVVTAEIEIPVEEEVPFEIQKSIPASPLPVDEPKPAAKSNELPWAKYREAAAADPMIVK